MNQAKSPLNMACKAPHHASIQAKASSPHPDVDKRAESERELGFELLPPNVDVHYRERCRAKNTPTMESNPTESRTTEMCSLSWRLKPIKLTGKAQAAWQTRFSKELKRSCTLEALIAQTRVLRLLLLSASKSTIQRNDADKQRKRKKKTFGKCVINSFQFITWTVFSFHCLLIEIEI